jgi:hypothetical protein
LPDHAVVGDAALHRARQVVGVDDVERAAFGALGGKVQRAARRGRAVVADNDRSRGGGQPTAPGSANAGTLITVMLGAKCMCRPRAIIRIQRPSVNRTASLTSHPVERW